jgi:hypothetical protein
MKQRVGSKITGTVSDQERAELLEHPRMVLTNGSQDDIIKAYQRLAIREAFTIDESTKAEDVVRAVIENRRSLALYTPKEMKEMLEELGFITKPLNKSSTWKGVPFEEGGGYRINFLGNGYFQFHPQKGSHHNSQAYWRISCSKLGDVRYDLSGELVPK